MTTILWDADYLVYAAGFSVQKTERAVLHCEELVDVFDDADKMKARLSDFEGYSVPPAVYSRVVMEDDAEVRAKHNLRSMIEVTLKQVDEAFDTGNANFAMYLTGNGNWRDDIATIRPYKGNRSRTERPVLFAELRQYLVDVWGASMIHHREADDAIATTAFTFRVTGEDHVIVHVDKDLKLIPGKHFIPGGKGAGVIGPLAAKRYHYKQMITGDAVDNIGGVYKGGPKLASTLIQKGMSDAAMWAAVVGAYQDSLTKYGDATGYSYLGPRKAALENAQLLWLETMPGERWQPPTSQE